MLTKWRLQEVLQPRYYCGGQICCVRLYDGMCRTQDCCRPVRHGGLYRCRRNDPKLPGASITARGVLSLKWSQRLLKDNGVDPYLVTAGEHKRTIDVIGEVTPESEQKLKEELAQIHEAFKNHVVQYRPQVDMATVSQRLIESFIDGFIELTHCV